MCGFAYYNVLKGDLDLSDLAGRAVEVLKKRGPDASNYVISPSKRELFCHTRLVIMGDQQHGIQPAISKENNSILLFNGEIYNYKDLKKSYPNNVQILSDTEYLLERLNVYKDYNLNDLNGMFAVASRCFSEDYLVLARDLAGQKPLYYGTITNNGVSVFCAVSDLRCISSCLGNKLNIDLDIKNIKHYLKYGMTQSGESLISGISQVPPNTLLKFEHGFEKPKLVKEIYDISSPCKPVNRKSRNNLVIEMDKYIKNAVFKHLTSDVPIALFLSGGIDSSLVASYATDLLEYKPTAYTIKFADKYFDESEEAAIYAKQLGLEHEQINFPVGYDLVELIKNVLHSIDEPFCDLSSIPTYFLAKSASLEHKVALSGDGGDELFAGYNRHILARNKIINSKLVALLPKISSCPAVLKKVLPEKLYSNLNKLISLAGTRTKAEKYENILATDRVSKVNLDLSLVKDIFDEDFLNFDFQIYLPSLVLRKVDRMTMANGFECRAPLLSPDLVNFCRTVSFNEKTKFGQKSLLKQLHGKKFQIVSRRNKMGFSISRNVFHDPAVLCWLFEQRDLGFADHGMKKQFDNILISLSNKNSSLLEINILWKILVYRYWASKVVN